MEKNNHMWTAWLSPGTEVIRIQRWNCFTFRDSQNRYSINYSVWEIQLMMFAVYNQFQPFPGLELIPDRIHALSWHGDSFTKCWPPDGCSRDLDGGETFSISENAAVPVLPSFSNPRDIDLIKLEFSMEEKCHYYPKTTSFWRNNDVINSRDLTAPGGLMQTWISSGDH